MEESLRSLVCKSIKDLFIDRSPQTKVKIALWQFYGTSVHNSQASENAVSFL